MPHKNKTELKNSRSKPSQSQQTTNWRDELANQDIQSKAFETNWNVLFVMLAETDNVLSTMYVQRFVESTSHVSQNEIKAIDIKVITDNIAKYTKRSKLYEEAASVLKTKEPLDVILQAFLIKDAVLIFKEEHLERIEAKAERERYKSESQEEKINKNEFGLVSVSTYIILVGFSDMNLIIELMNIKVQIQIVVYVSPKNILNQQGQKHTKNTAKALSSKELFWNSLVDSVTNNLNENYIKFNHLGLISYEPDYTDEMMKNITAAKSRIYEDVTLLLYDINDTIRQYITHLENTSIIEIPDFDPEQNSMKIIYDIISSNKPSEVTTVSVIVSNMIDAISFATASVNSIQSNNEPVGIDDKFKESKEYSLWWDFLNSNYKIRDQFFLSNNQKESSEQLMKFEYNDITNPTVIRYGNFAQELSYHIQDNDLEQSTLYYLKEMPIPLLWRKYHKREEKHNVLNDNFINLYRSFFPSENSSQKMIKRYIHLFGCKTLYDHRFKENVDLENNILNPSITKCDYLKRTPNAVPFDLNEKTRIITHEKSKKLEKLPDEISLEFDNEELFKSKDILNLIFFNNKEGTEDTSFHHIYDYTIFNEMNFSVTIQAINDAYKTFNCIRYKYLLLTDSIVLLFFNKKNSLRENIYEWTTKLQTPISFQNFMLTSPLIENHWIEPQSETEYLKQSDPDIIYPIFANKSIDVTIKNEEPLQLNENNLSQELDSSPHLFSTIESIQLAPKLLSDPNFLIGVERNTFEPLNEYILKKATKSKLKTNRKTYTPNVKIPEKIKSKPAEKKYLKFLSYNIHNGQITYSGKSTAFFSRDGTEVKIKKRGNTLNNIESLMVEVSLNKHRVIIHKEFPMNFTEKHFRISSANGIEITFREEQINTSQETELLEAREIEDYDHFNLYMSWPNGLVVNTVKKNGSDFPFYIKQSLHNQDNPRLRKEKFRCFSRNGEVLIFYTCGKVSVLRSDGTRYMCHTFSDPMSISVNDSEKLDNTAPNGKECIFPIKPSGYLITEATGKRYEVVNDEMVRQTNSLPVSIGVDSKLGEVYVKRGDKTSNLLKKNGVQVTKFVDGTKIITYSITEVDEYFVEWTEEENERFEQIRTDAFIISDGEDFPYKVENTPFVVISLVYIMEHPYYSTVTIDHSINVIKLQMPENQYIVIKNYDDYKIHLDDSTVIQISGNEIIGYYTACLQCRSYTQVVIDLNCSYAPSPSGTSKSSISKRDPSTNKHKTLTLTNKAAPLERNENSSFTTKYSPPISSVESGLPVLLKLSDCFGMIFRVDAGGECTTIKAESLLSMPGQYSDLQAGHHASGKCGTFAASSKRRRYFVLHRDLSGEELMYKSEYDESLNAANDVAWSSVIERNTDCDPDCKFAHILMPLQVKNATKRWLMESSKWPSTPTRLVNCDLKSFPEDMSWMKLWPGTVSDWLRPHMNPLTPPSVLSLRVLQKIEDTGWYKKCLIATKEFIKATDENFRQYSKLPNLTESRTGRNIQQTEHEENALSLIKSSKIEDSEQKSILKAREIFPPSLCRYLDRRWADVLDQKHFMRVLRLGDGAVPDYYRDEDLVTTPSQVTRTSNVHIKRETAIPGEGMGPEEPVADVEVQTSFESSSAEINVFNY